jgi:hypothetical protein
MGIPDAVSPDAWGGEHGIAYVEGSRLGYDPACVIREGVLVYHLSLLSSGRLSHFFCHLSIGA